MDKKSEKTKDHKECGDTDIGVQDYGAGGKREQLDGLWEYASKEVVGVDKRRLIDNCYGKEREHEKPSLVDEVIDHGPPMISGSRPKRVF
jgi:hypothetical protein